MATAVPVFFIERVERRPLLLSEGPRDLVAPITKHALPGHGDPFATVTRPRFCISANMGQRIRPRATEPAVQRAL